MPRIVVDQQVMFVHGCHAAIVTQFSQAWDDVDGAGCHRYVVGEGKACQGSGCFCFSCGSAYGGVLGVAINVQKWHFGG